MNRGIYYISLFLGSPRVRKRLPETGANGRRRINPVPAVKHNGRNVHSRHRLLLRQQPGDNAFQRRGSENGGVAAGDGGDERRRCRELTAVSGNLLL